MIRPPTSRSICGEVIGNRLSARRADTRNVRAVRSPRSLRIAARDRVDVERRAAGLREVGDAEHARDAVADRCPVGVGTEHDLDAPHQHAHFADAEVAPSPRAGCARAAR